MQPLILLGASVRAAACSALRAGFAPYAIDLFADRDLAAICPAVKIDRFPSEFLSVLAAAPQAPWVNTGGLENHPRLVDRLAAIRPLWGNRGPVLRPVRDPLLLARAAEAAGCLAPSLRLPGAAGISRGSAAWLIKPRRSSGGLGIGFASSDEIARPQRGTYLQQYIEGESASAVFVAAGGRAVLLGATRQLLGRDFGLDRPFLYVGSLGPLPLRDDERSQLHRLGDVLAEQFRLVGLFNVDFVRTNDGLYVIEVNPRYSASVEVLERVSQFHSIALHAAACQTGTLPNETAAQDGQFAAKAVVYARHRGVVPAALDRLGSKWNQPGLPPGIADLPRIGDAIRGGQPVVTVFSEASSLTQVERLLRQRMAAVEQLL